jgi:hypothetical protein
MDENKSFYSSDMLNSLIIQNMGASALWGLKIIM